MKLVIAPAALADLEAAANFYSVKGNAALGLAFVAEFEYTINTAWPTRTSAHHFTDRRADFC